MKRSNVVLMLLTALLFLGLQGCADDGDDGAPGAQGEPGPPGGSEVVYATGTAESGTDSSLTDNQSAWTTDQQVGRVVRIVGGTGSGQSRTVLSNTNDTLTVTKFWDTEPDATSMYEIASAPEVFEPEAAVEACVGCHGAGQVRPVGDITDVMDVHYVDTDLNGPLTDSGYRQLLVTVTAVDVSRTVDPDSVIIDFGVMGIDEFGAMVPVPTLLASDGRFTIARLNPGAIPEDSTFWESLITRTDAMAVQATAERFRDGTFVNNNDGTYRYTSDFDPATAPAGVAPIAGGDTMRVALQISAGDLPPSNGWCDFDASLAGSSACGSASRTRDIVQTDTCNGCHGVTSDTQLRLHGSRTEVEYCVTCHNPGSTDGQSGNTVDFKVMIHKIHYGSSLANQPYQIVGFGNRVHDYSFVNFTKDIDDCVNCHTGGGLDEQNWSTVPTIEACQSCHDDLDITSPTTTHGGNQQTDNTNCGFCHPQTGPYPATAGALPQPVETMHVGAARRAEGSLYSGAGNGYETTIVGYDPASRDLTVQYSVTRNGAKMDLANDPEWTAGGGASRLAVVVGWNTEPDYDNDGSGSDPAQPISINALTAPNEVAPGVYETTVSLPSAVAAGSVTVGLEGHPAADVDGDG
ncbi:MAG: OmcA/MtrC family decaheme c-type cytochrome, partial [Planctomycetota bacterium]